MAQTIYSFKNVAAAIDGVQLNGFWDGDDVISIAPNSDIGSLLVGAGGDALMSISTDRSAVITLKLQHTSNAHALLERIYQSLLNGVVKTFSFGCTDTGNGEGGSSKSCMIISHSTVQFGKGPSLREWKIAAGAWEPNQISYTGTPVGLGATGGFNL